MMAIFTAITSYIIKYLEGRGGSVGKVSDF